MGRKKSSNGEGAGAMKRILENKYLSLIARFILGIVFIYASIDKLADPALFAQSIGNYKILPSDIALIVATVLPWLEMLCGVSLLIGFFTGGSSLTVSVLLFIFTLFVISALLRSLDISCGCFTQDPNAHKIGWMKVAENIGLLSLSVYLFFSTGKIFSIDGYKKEFKRSETV